MKEIVPLPPIQTANIAMGQSSSSTTLASGFESGISDEDLAQVLLNLRDTRL